MSTFSWLSPYDVVSYLVGSLSYMLGAGPGPEDPGSDSVCHGINSILVLGMPHPLKEGACRQAAATYGLRYVNLWQELAKGEGEDVAAVRAALAANQVLPVPAVLRLLERLLLGQVPPTMGFVLDSFPLNLDALLAVESRFSGTALLVLHFDSPAMGPPLGPPAAAAAEPATATGAADPVPTEEQARVYRYMLELAATHFESQQLLRRLDVAQGEAAVLAEVHRHCGRARLRCQDEELEDLVNQLGRDPVECLCTIARNLAESGEERYRRINIKTDRFQQHVGRFPFAMRLLERLGFETDQPTPGIASVTKEPPVYVAYTIHILCEQRARLLKDHHLEDWDPAEALSPKSGGCMFAGLASSPPGGGGGCPFASLPAPGGVCPVSGKSAPSGTCPVSGMTGPPMEGEFSAV
eukprot:EG_transcript_9225